MKKRILIFSVFQADKSLDENISNHYAVLYQLQRLKKQREIISVGEGLESYKKKTEELSLAVMIDSFTAYEHILDIASFYRQESIMVVQRISNKVKACFFDLKSHTSTEQKPLKRISFEEAEQVEGFFCQANKNNLYLWSF